jgi:hypothetical protein
LRRLVIEVAEDLADVLAQDLKRPGPGREFAVAIDLDVRKHRQLTRPHPAHVGEVSRRAVNDPEHLFALNPLAVRQRQRHPVRREQVQDVLARLIAEPVRVPELNRKAQVGLKQRQELFDRRERARREVGRQLNENQRQFLIKRTHPLAEPGERVFALPQAVHVRDLLRQLERVSEACGRALVPGGD